MKKLVGVLFSTMILVCGCGEKTDNNQITTTTPILPTSITEAAQDEEIETVDTVISVCTGLNGRNEVTKVNEMNDTNYYVEYTEDVPAGTVVESTFFYKDDELINQVDLPIGRSNVATYENGLLIDEDGEEWVYDDQTIENGTTVIVNYNTNGTFDIKDDEVLSIEDIENQ